MVVFLFVVVFVDVFLDVFVDMFLAVFVFVDIPEKLFIMIVFPTESTNFRPVPLLVSNVLFDTMRDSTRDTLIPVPPFVCMVFPSRVA